MGSDLRVKLRHGALLSLLLLSACRQEHPTPGQNSEEPQDRLTEGETLPDTEVTFGLEVPRGMQLTARFPDVAQLDGTLSLSQLISYYKDRVSVAAVEMGAAQAVFPLAYIRGDSQKRLFRIVISKHGKHSKVRITDVTPAPAVQGLTERERWERAGLRPDGTQQDRLQVY